MAEENKDKTGEMWKTLLRIFKKQIQNNGNNSGKDLGQILKMITNNLTFEDPGLFSTYPSQNMENNHRRLYVYNLWLINQLISVFTDEKFIAAHSDNLALQMDMFSAANIKQSWFFYDIVQRLLNFLNTLNELKFPMTGQLPSTYDLNSFHTNNSGTDIECEFTLIEVRSETIRHKLVSYAVDMISHSMVLIANSDNDFRHEMDITILKTFKVVELPTKTKCVDYFIQLLDETAITDDKLRQEFGYLLSGIHSIIAKILEFRSKYRIPIYEDRDVTDFFESLVSLFKQMRNKVDLLDSIDDKVHIFDVSIEILKEIFNANLSSTEMENLFELVVSKILIFLRINLNSSRTPVSPDVIHKLRVLVSETGKYPDVLKLLEICVLDDIKKGNRITWTKILTQFDREIAQNLTTHDYIHHILRVYMYIFKSTMNIQQLGKIHGVEIPDLFLGGSLIEYGENFLRVFEAVQVQKFYDLYQLLVKSSSYIVSINEFSTLPTYLQNQMFNIAISPFLHVNSINFSLSDKKFAKELKSLMLQLPSELIQILQLVSLDQLKFIMLNLNDPLDVQFQPTILEILKAIIITDDFIVDFKKVVIMEHLLLTIICCKVKKDYLDVVLDTVINDQRISGSFSKILKKLICTMSGRAQISLTYLDDRIALNIKCPECDRKPISSTAIVDRLIITCSIEKTIEKVIFSKLQNIYDWIKSDNQHIRYNTIEALPAIFAHSNQIWDEDKWIELFTDDNLEARTLFAKHIDKIFIAIQKVNKNPGNIDNLIKKCLAKLLHATELCVTTVNKSLQECVLNCLKSFALCPAVTGESFVHCFRMTFFFMIKTESCFPKEASMIAAEICASKNIQPRTIFWNYKSNILKVMLSLGVCLYLEKEISLNRSLSHAAKMLGFTGTREFISKNFQRILAILIPFSIKHPRVQELLNEVAQSVQQNLSDALAISFLTIYPYVVINESTEVSNNCLDFVIQNTGSTLYRLLHNDIKKTVAEILINYRRNPECVIRVFRCILFEDGTVVEPDKTIYKEMSEYIVKRFLGILTFFESSLLNVENDYSTKKETLLSLGDIIRFLGSNYITSFRFKILATLKTALSIEDVPGLPIICAQVWTIFIHTVDIQALGPLLSTIFVSLEQLLVVERDAVNAIAKYLVVTNGSLLSLHIPDLFFIEDTTFSNEIKEVVKKCTDRVTNDEFNIRLYSMVKHINHENLGVRVYGLKYLKQLFAKHRAELNHLIVGRNNMDPILESLLENLITGCKHVDENLQLAAGECLGELGAIEPSLLPPNYSPQTKFALGIHTDLFAMMALDELCRAYQFQNDTKYVDNFSLAIQEILHEREVCPLTRKKMEVWEAIPERMRPLMEPLLTSCYEDFRKTLPIVVHPIFGSSKCRSHEDWAFVWVQKIIDSIQNVKTRNLLKSFRPSIKRNSNILAMFLPYILLHGLQLSDSEARNQMFEELNFVFETVTTTSHQFQNTGQDDSTANLSRMRGIKSIYFTENPTRATTISSNPQTQTDIGIKCAKLGFNLVDFLTKWLRQYTKVYKNTADSSDYTVVETFCARFDKRLIARANFKCNEYARALMYIESYIEEDPDRLQSELSFLAEIYAELMNPDSLEGALSLKTSAATLSEQILANNITGRLQESATCFERMMQVGEITPVHMNDMMQCYLGLDQPETALLVAEGLLKRISDRHQHLLVEETRAEPLWRLSRFDELETLVGINEIREQSSWGVKCGQLLLNIRKQNITEFEDNIQKTRLNILNMLRMAGIEQNAYHKGYPHVMKLHFISEFEKIERAIIKDLTLNGGGQTTIRILAELMVEWDLRAELLQPTAKMMEPLLCLRRILLIETRKLIEEAQQIGAEMRNTLLKTIDNHIGGLWLKSTALARKAGLIQQAQLYLMNAEGYNCTELFLEKAKLHWKKGDQASTFKILERGLKEIESCEVRKLPRPQRKICADAKLLIATYNAESMNMETNLNLKYFKESVFCMPDNERSLVQLAQYTDRIYAALSEEDQQKERGMEMLNEVMIFYGKSMMYGCHYIYQSIPRMLAIWFDFTARMKRDDIYRKYCEKMNKSVDKFCEILPAFTFFTAFSQLVSRICHPSHDVYTVLKTILVKLILNFPQQSMWMISSVFKSSYPNRVKRCTEVFQDKRLADPSIQSLINDFNSLAEKLIELTNKSIPDNMYKPTVSKLVPSLPKLFAQPNFCDIMLPIQQHMLPTLPPSGKRDSPATTFNAFPNRLVSIRSINEEITILISLQHPRKITLIGDDGQEYIFMLKPNDDLRKDFRLMEFNAIVKEYLHQDPTARERRLNIRTYAVLPLNEMCGIIEWVPNLHSFRSIIISIYKQRKLVTLTNADLKNARCTVNDPITKKRDIFLNTLVAKHPPVFEAWFKDRFTTPYNWYQARSSYIKTTAVMSMVGYVLGLGDRHGENILFDATNGDTVHVDFNCLFNKGETFEYPEKVPFRLTQNMVHAMGPLGIEGLYRRCCEITLKILRAQKSTLMSVLRPFVYDPLVSWSRKNDKCLERTDAQAMTNVQQIEERLKGFVKINRKTSNMPLSAEGQVNSIIAEAISIDNLAEMYIGWGAYL